MGTPSSAIRLDDASRDADELRIARLRAEVEELKQQGTMVEARSREPDISPRLNDDLNSETSGISRLNDWCAEVDAALGFPPTGADTAAGALDPSASPECLDTIENHLLAARMRG